MPAGPLSKSCHSLRSAVSMLLGRWGAATEPLRHLLFQSMLCTACCWQMACHAWSSGTQEVPPKSKVSLSNYRPWRSKEELAGVQTMRLAYTSLLHIMLSRSSSILPSVTLPDSRASVWLTSRASQVLFFDDSGQTTTHYFINCLACCFLTRDKSVRVRAHVSSLLLP